MFDVGHGKERPLLPVQNTLSTAEDDEAPVSSGKLETASKPKDDQSLQFSKLKTAEEANDQISSLLSLIKTGTAKILGEKSVAVSKKPMKTPVPHQKATKAVEEKVGNSEQQEDLMKESGVKKQETDFSRIKEAKTQCTESVLGPKITSIPKTFPHAASDAGKTPSQKQLPSLHTVAGKARKQAVKTTLILEESPVKEKSQRIPGTRKSTLEISSKILNQKPTKEVNLVGVARNTAQGKQVFSRWRKKLNTDLKRLLFNAVQKLVEKFHYFETVKIYELFPFLVIDRKEWDYDLPMLYITEMIMPDEIDLETDEDQMGKVQLQGKPVNRIQTLGGSPICLQVVDGATWTPFLPEARLYSQNFN